MYVSCNVLCPVAKIHFIIVCGGIFVFQLPEAAAHKCDKGIVENREGDADRNQNQGEDQRKDRQGLPRKNRFALGLFIITIYSVLVNGISQYIVSILIFVISHKNRPSFLCTIFEYKIQLFQKVEYYLLLYFLL